MIYEKKIQSLLAIFLFFFYTSCALAQNTKIVWRVTDWPPMYILYGEQKGKGLYDELAKLYQRHLPEYTHLTTDINTRRAYEIINNPEPGTVLCHPSVIKREAEGIAHVSNINSLLLTHEIVITADKAKLLDISEGSYSLEKLITDNSLRGGLASFWTHLFLIKYEHRHKNFSNLYYMPENYYKLMNMLFADRIDYIVQYAPVIRYSEKQLKRENKMKMIPIKETLDNPYVRVAVGCTRNEAGKKVIATINKVISDASLAAEIEEIQLRWYDEADKQKLKEYYKKEL